jgi:hypothetical protein
MASHYERYRFSVTCRTDDLAVVFCLRALCQFASDDVLPQIGWGGTKESEWRAARNQITLRFTSAKSRDRFVGEATRLLPAGSWREVRSSDSDPARRQRPPH